MAEESIILPATPETTEGYGGKTRRNSFGKVGSSNSGEKIVPHYLRASTGSCHDFCKYGKKHAMEEKARRPFMRRNAKKPPDELGTELDRKTSIVFKQESSRNSKSHTPNTPEIIKREVSSAKSMDGQTPVVSKVLAKKKTSREVLLTKSVDDQMPVLPKMLAMMKISPEMSLMESVDGQSSALREIIAKKKTSVQEILAHSVDSQSSVASETSSEKKTSTTGRKKTPLMKRTPPGATAHLSPNKIEQHVLSSPEKLEVSSRRASPKPKELNLSAKRPNLSKTKLSSLDASEVTGGQRNSDLKRVQRTDISKIAENKVQVSPRASLALKTSPTGVRRVRTSPKVSLSSKPSLTRAASINTKKHRDLKVVSLRNQNKIKNANAEKPKIKNVHADRSNSELEKPNKDMVQEKTLYVIKIETENTIVESELNGNVSAELSPPPLFSSNSPLLPKSTSSSSSCHIEEDEEESEYTESEAEADSLSEFEGSEYLEEAKVMEGVQKGVHRKAGMVSSEDKDSQSMKLRFRRGKVVDVQSENNGPRRLKFRRGRVLGENQNLRTDTRRSFKRRGADGGIDGIHNSEKVVLRHQEVHGKKDAQGLFNNVIEETASKLVESRKSKVKALVGAFETVISLQDGKPSANTVS